MCFQTGYYGDLLNESNQTAVEHIFDENGNNVTSQEEYAWIKDAVDFDSADDDNAGMMLTDSDAAYATNWGTCKKTSSTRNYYGDRTRKHLYRSSFILG